MAQASNPNLEKASVLSGVAALVRKNCPKDEIVSDNQKAAVVSSLKNMKEQKAVSYRCFFAVVFVVLRTADNDSL